MTLREFIDLVQEQLASLYPIQECKAIAVRLLKECIAGYKGYEHLVDPAAELETFQLEENANADMIGANEYLLSCIERLATGEPLQYVLGYEWFCGHRFNVAPGVLIPRPETEELVNKVIEVTESDTSLQRPLRILDICTGSGCIAWSLAAALPQAEVCACDISRQALQIAQSQNIHTPDRVPARVNFFECDILSSEAEQIILSFGKFDIIVSNPPYVCDSEKLQMRPNVLDHEPHLALFVPDKDPLKFYREIVRLSGRILNPGGVLLFEINERFGPQTAQLMQEVGYIGCQVQQDLFGKDRIVVGYKNFS